MPNATQVVVVNKALMQMKETTVLHHGPLWKQLMLFQKLKIINNALSQAVSH